MSLIAQIPPPPFAGFDLGPLHVRMYGLVIAVGALLAIMLVVRRYEERGGEAQVAEHAGLLALAGGFLGARIGYIIPRFLQDGPHGAAYIERPQDILAIWQGGLAFFGGLVGGAAAVLLYLWWRKADTPAYLDAIAPGLPLAQAFGRWGNYFNQELFGRPTDLPWALQVDPIPARTAERFPGATTFHPTFLYESLWNLGLVGVILLIDRKGWLRRRGSLFFVYLIGYGVGRGWIEALRVDTVERYFGLSRNNWVALLVVLIGVAGLMWWEKRGPGPLTADVAADDAGSGDGPDRSTGDRRHVATTGAGSDPEGAADGATPDADVGPVDADDPRDTEPSVDADDPSDTEPSVDADDPSDAEPSVDADDPSDAEPSLDAEERRDGDSS